MKLVFQEADGTTKILRKITCNFAALADGKCADDIQYFNAETISII